mmetsp:Transcript_9473/g.13695  ORF Transcript_9473/g.13695 Transcript_9473/m.13695 type:complete len:131 (-) Transcript_9473:754-1146(-)
MLSKRASLRNDQDIDAHMMLSDESLEASATNAFSHCSRTDLLNCRRRNNVNELLARWDRDTHAAIAPLAWHTARQKNVALNMQRSLGNNFWNIKEDYMCLPAVQSSRLWENGVRMCECQKLICFQPVRTP